MKLTSIKVFAPATVANVACGFDILGFALDEPGDELHMRLTSEPGVELTSITGDGGVLPLESYKNTAGVAALALLRHVKANCGVVIEVHKKMPLGSGLGSSAASAAGSAFALNRLLGEPLTRRDLVPLAMEGERVACGSAHADNVAPALMGGITLIRSYAPLDIIPIPCSLDLFCTILHPRIEIRTEEARRLLGQTITMQQHVAQSGNVAGLMVGLLQGDAKLIGRCLEDVIAEPVRSKLIPGFKAIKQAAKEAGALGCSISGSGPSIFALSTSHHLAMQIGAAMQSATELPSDLYISRINQEGPRIIP